MNRNLQFKTRARCGRSVQALLGWVFLMFATALPAAAETGLALAPMRVEIQLSPGGQHTDSLRLSNDSTGPSRVRAELLDWYLDETLTPQFSENYEPEKAFSCRQWLQVNPREMDMTEGGAQRVRYTVRVPEGTPAGEYHCGAGFVTLPPIRQADTPIGMFIAVRAVAAIYVVVGSASSQPSMKELGLRSNEGGWEAVALFENQGSRHFRVQGFIELTDARGQVVEKVEYPYMPVLPKRQQIFPIRLKTELAPGTYTLRSHADVGLPEILQAATQVVVPEPKVASAPPAASAKAASEKRETPAVKSAPVAPASTPSPATPARRKPLATTASAKSLEIRSRD